MLDLRVLAAVLFCIAASSLTLAAGGDMGGGNGSQASPYLIEDFDDFLEFSDLANATTYWSAGVYTRLDCNLNLDPALPGRQTYTTAPIAPDTDPSSSYHVGAEYEGIFDGDNHTISNLTINTAGASNKYLGLFGLIFSYISTSQVKDLGIINVNITGGNGSHHLGGLCGSNGNAYAYIYKDGGTITNCYTTGSLSGGDGSSAIGGLCGYNRSSITACYTTCSVSSGNDSYSLGGLCGSNGGGTVINCYATGSVTAGADTSIVGGFCGLNDGSITNCYSTGSTTSKGFCGVNRSIITGCFWDEDSSGNPISDGGWKKSTSQMMAASTFIGWNDGSWVIDEGNDYPRLAWEDSAQGLPAITTNYPARTYAGNGDGIPFELADSTDIVCMSLRPMDWNKNFVLVADIDMAAVTNYYPPGNISGFIDGQNHTLSNLTIDYGVLGNAFQLGFIGTLFSPGRIENLGLENVTVTGYNSLGGLCGKNDGGTIINCSATGSVTAGNGTSYIGGLCGSHDEGSITNCFADCSVIGGVDSRKLGGLCGTSSGTITNCYAAGSVTGDSHVGGLCGSATSIAQSFSETSVFGQGNYIGGLCGYVSGLVTNCYSTGPITAGVNSTYIGGLCGLTHDLITNCYAASFITVDAGSTYIGGLCGINWGTFINCYWDGDTAGYPVSDGGWKKSTSQMMTAATFIDWNDGSWVIDEGNDYPRLTWEDRAQGLPAITTDYPVRTYTGDGDDIPFELADSTDIVCMMLRPMDWDKNFVLIADIDMSAVTDYYPPNIFTGRIDGRNHVISNLTIDSMVIGIRSYLGFIGRLNPPGWIKNLGLDNLTISGYNDSRYLGGLCGLMGTYENYPTTGGIIENCCVNGSINGGDNSQDLGGLCGRLWWYGIVSDSYATGSVTGGVESSYLGGLCGRNQDYNTIKMCYSTVAVTGGNNSSRLGGLCGENLNGRYLEYSYATGPVAGGTGSYYLGGLCGLNRDSTISHCFWDTQTSGTTTGYHLDPVEPGTIIDVYGKTTVEMQDINTYLAIGWDFDFYDGDLPDWWMLFNPDYPKLFWQGSFNADIDLDGDVNLVDFIIMVSQWLDIPGSPSADIAPPGGDGIVDIADYLLLAGSWLNQH